MSTSDTSKPEKTVKRKSRFLWWLTGAAVLLGLCILALPTMLGSKWIYTPLLKRLAREQYQLDIESVHLRWFSPLEFRGISVRDSSTADFPALVSIESIRSNRGLFGYLLNGRNIGKLEIRNPRVDIALLEDGSNLEKLIKAVEESRKGEEPKAKSKPKLDLDVAIRGLSVHVAPRDSRKALEVVPPLNVDLAYRAIEGEAMLIVEPAQLLDQTTLTPELVQLGLGMAVPLLAKSAWFDGKVSLATEKIVIPLDSPKKSSGKAKLTLHQVRSGPSEPLVVEALNTVAYVRGKEPVHELIFVDGSEVLIEVQDERVFHSGLQAGLPKLDPRLQVATQGFVGLEDKSLDLAVEIPVPIEQLALREKIQKLGVPRVKLPIGGTLDHPEVRWEEMRSESAMLLSLMATQLRQDSPISSTVLDALGGVTEGKADEAIGATIDLLKSLRESRNSRKEKPEDILPPDDKDEAGKKADESGRRRPFRDALRKAILGD